MSKPNVDKHNRLRDKIVAFRMSPQEAEQLDHYVCLSGLNKQDYLINRVLQKDIVVQGSSRIYKALTEEMSQLHEDLIKVSEGKQELTEEMSDIISLIGKIVKDMNDVNK